MEAVIFGWKKWLNPVMETHLNSYLIMDLKYVPLLIARTCVSVNPTAKKFNTWEAHNNAIIWKKAVNIKVDETTFLAFGVRRSMICQSQNVAVN